jgi:glycogen(starch) synthase
VVADHQDRGPPPLTLVSDHRTRPPVSRVILWPSAYLPALGGVEELTRHLALALVAEGDQVEVWSGTAHTSDKARVETIDGLTVRRFPLPLPARRVSVLARLPLAGTRTLQTMRRAVDDFRPDLVHVQCFGPNGVYATLLSRVTGIPLVLSLQGETFMDDHKAFERSRTLRTGLRIGLRRAAGVTGCSQYTLTDAENRFRLPPGHGQVVFNGVDLAAASSPSESDPAPFAEGRFVLALGRVVENKGFDLLIEAFASVAASHKDVDLVVGGDGSALSSLRELAAHLGIADRVRFPGRLSRIEVVAAMTQAEVFVMPSRVEPFGIVILEAWRAGLPVVATSNGGPAEFMHDGEDGVLVDPFDRAALAGALDGLLSDPQRCRALGAAGRRRVEEFDWPRVAARYRSLYAEVLGRGSDRVRQG